MANCPNCGEPVGESATACTECGTPLTGASGSGGQTEGQPADDGRTPQERTGAGGHPPGEGQPPRGGQSSDQPNQQSGQPSGRSQGQPNQQGGQPSGQPQGGQPTQPQDGQPNQHRQGGQPAEQPPQGGQPNQPQGRSPQTGQQYQQPPGGQQPQQGQPPQDGGPPRGQSGGGHSRRDLLKYGGGAAVLGGVGILGYTMLTGSGGSPVGTTRSFIEALDEGDVQRANSLIHDDAPMSEIGAFAGSTLESTDISVESAEVVSQSQDRAEVRVELSVSAGAFGGGTSDGLVELRTQNGQWRVWQMN